MGFSYYNLLLLVIVFCFGFVFLKSYSQTDELFELIESGNFSDAIKILDDVTAKNPNDFEAIYLKGLLYQRLGEYEKAIKNYDEALLLSPNNENILKSKFVSETLLNSDVGGLAIPISPYRLDSVFNENVVVADGDDGDWPHIESKIQTFEGHNVDLNSPYELTGEILVQNNEDTLQLLLRLHTPIPVQGNEHSILLAFDENADGDFATGDNVIFIKTKDDDTTEIRDAYRYEDGLRDDPPEHRGETEALIKYSGEKELIVEILLPYRGVNDYYDFEMLVEQEFIINLNYNIVNSQTFEETSFNSIFVYSMAHDPSSSVKPALEIFSIFGVTVLSSVIVASWFTKNYARARVSKKFILIIVGTLALSVLAIVFNPQFITELWSWLSILSKILPSFYVESSLYAVLTGITVGMLSYNVFNRSQKIVSYFSFSQKMVLYICVAIFVISLVSFAANPFLFVVKSIANIFADNNVPIDASHVDVLHDLVGNLFAILLLPAVSVLVIWIPSLFLIFVLCESRGKNLSANKKVVVMISSILSFVIFSGLFVYSLYFGLSYQDNLIVLLIGPVISGVTLSFLAAGGYLETIKENWYRLRTGLSPYSKTGTHSVNSRRFYAIIALSVNLIGLTRYLLLLSVPLAYFQMPEFYSIVSQSFVEIISLYSINTVGQTVEGARLVYNSFVVLFSIFWLYDVVMILRGFHGEYLNSENRAFRFFKNNVGIFSALLFLCIIITFMSFQTVFIDSGRINEMVSVLPSWVRENIGIQEQGIVPLDENLLNFQFVWGLAALTGLIYALRRFTLKHRQLLSD